jgi:hypothetical protein
MEFVLDICILKKCEEFQKLDRVSQSRHLSFAKGYNHECAAGGSEGLARACEFFANYPSDMQPL